MNQANQVTSFQVENEPPDFIKRNYIKFCGSGPRFYQNKNASGLYAESCQTLQLSIIDHKFWPRDAIDLDQEIKKIIDCLRTKIQLSLQSEANIQRIVRDFIDCFKNCNIQSLFDKFCPDNKDFFHHNQYQVRVAIDCYVPYKNVMKFCLNILQSIKPERYKGQYMLYLFGSRKNFNLFKSHLKIIINSNDTLKEIDLNNIIKFGHHEMDLNQLTWLSLQETYKSKVLTFRQILRLILKLIIETIRRYFYVTLSNPYNKKLFYYRFDFWRKVYDKEVNAYIDLGILSKMDLNLRPPQSDMTKSILRFYLKYSSLRPICSVISKKTRYDTLTSKTRAILVAIRNRMSGSSTRFIMSNFLKALQVFQEKLRCNQNIHIVRADIRDCFMSIIQDKLRSIIKSEFVKLADNDNKVTLYQIYHSLGSSGRKIWTINLEKYKKDSELVQILYQEKLTLEDFDSQLLRPILIRPVLYQSKGSKSRWILLSGLRQGAPLSPFFSSIYIQHAFSTEFDNLSQQLNNSMIFIYVDDIFFISTELETSKQFMHRMLKGFSAYNLHINVDKLSCNFQTVGLNSQTCRLDKFATYFKINVSLENLSCTYNYESFKSSCISLETRCEPYLTEYKFFKSLKAFATSNPSFILYDYKLNGTDLIIKNLFERSAFVAFKTAAILMYSLRYKSIDNQVPNLLPKVIHIVSKCISRTINSNVKKGNIVSNIKLFHVKLIVAGAFESTWSTKKLRHRSKELKKLKTICKRQFQKYWRLYSNYDNNDVKLNNLAETVSEMIRFSSQNAFFSHIKFMKEATSY